MAVGSQIPFASRLKLVSADWTAAEDKEAGPSVRRKFSEAVSPKERRNSEERGVRENSGKERDERGEASNVGR